jgi:protein-tyrosine phosphatase
MIDLHCHFLPGVDDGARTLEEGLELAAAAVAAGITTSVMTPHVHPGRWDNSLASIGPIYTEFSAALRVCNIPLTIRPAGEVRISPEIITMVEDGTVPFIGQLNGYRILLLEFPHSHVLLGADKLMRWLLSRRIRPMIAHPERNREIMRDIEKLYPFVDMGCLMQVTAGSLIGNFGSQVEKTALELLARGWVDVVATDSHNLEFRPPLLDQARNFLATHCGEDRATRLTETTPGQIIGIQG